MSCLPVLSETMSMYLMITRHVLKCECRESSKDCRGYHGFHERQLQVQFNESMLIHEHGETCVIWIAIACYEQLEKAVIPGNWYNWELLADVSVYLCTWVCIFTSAMILKQTWWRGNSKPGQYIIEAISSAVWILAQKKGCLPLPWYWSSPPQRLCSVWLEDVWTLQLS